VRQQDTQLASAVEVCVLGDARPHITGTGCQGTEVEKKMDYQQFQHAHSAQLANIPAHHWRALYEKLQFEVTIPPPSAISEILNEIMS